MTKTHFRLGVAAIFAAILLYNLTSPSRYTHKQEGSQVMVFDGLTGKAYWTTESATYGWREYGKYEMPVKPGKFRDTHIDGKPIKTNP